MNRRRFLNKLHQLVYFCRVYVHNIKLNGLLIYDLLKLRIVFYWLTGDYCVYGFFDRFEWHNEPFFRVAAVDSNLQLDAIELLQDYPFLSAAQIHDRLKEHFPELPEVSERTVYNTVRLVDTMRDQSKRVNGRKKSKA